jgi:hypothetical protein
VKETWQLIDAPLRDSGESAGALTGRPANPLADHAGKRAHGLPRVTRRQLRGVGKSSQFRTFQACAKDLSVKRW